MLKFIPSLNRRLLSGLVLIGLSGIPADLRGQAAAANPSADETATALRQEEALDYYKKWLDEDVKYLITAEEKSVFQKLTTVEEKESFVEQFWRRRDTDLSTAINEFKEEHYRRIAYANEHFYSGEPGWMTDRGRVYIVFGPPDEKEAHPAGGYYKRPMHEGGGSTATFPFEIWWYRHLEGVGNDIELEFVDRTNSNQYRLALRPEEKDALLYVAGAGETLAEELGIAKKEDRPYFRPERRGLYPMIHERAKDNPFQRYETYSLVQRAREIQYKDLQEIVKVNLSYDNLPFQVRKDYFRLNDDQVLVPITIEVENKNLTFEPQNEAQVAKLAVYGIVTSLQNRVVAEFDDDMSTLLDASRSRLAQHGRSVYQKILTLDKRMRYKLDLAVKDLTTGNLGVLRQAIIPPSFETDLCFSSLVLSSAVEELAEMPLEEQMFTLGDVKLRPNLQETFSPRDDLAIYLQVYNFALDQATQIPAIDARYRILQGTKAVLELEDHNGESVKWASGGRIVLLKYLPVSLLNLGRYQLEVTVRDRVQGKEIRATQAFELADPGL